MTEFENYCKGVMNTILDGEGTENAYLFIDICEQFKKGLVPQFHENHNIIPFFIYYLVKYYPNRVQLILELYNFMKSEFDEEYPHMYCEFMCDTNISYVHTQDFVSKSVAVEEEAFSTGNFTKLSEMYNTIYIEMEEKFFGKTQPFENFNV
jgi:hypothetical protein